MKRLTSWEGDFGIGCQVLTLEFPRRGRSWIIGAVADMAVTAINMYTADCQLN